MRFLVDAQLPPALARRLRELDHNAEHVFDIGNLGAPDDAIWAHAVAVGAVIISKDEDFAERARRPGAETKVVWIRLGNVTNAALWRALDPRFAEIIEALEAGERLIEVA